jgi:cytochrome P450
MSAEMRNNSSRGQCPINQLHCGHQKTARPQEPTISPVECDERGIWYINGFKEARAVLRNGTTKQAGVGAEVFEKLSFVTPLIYMEGKKHQQYRKQTARFFTPKAANANYDRLIEQQVDQFIADLKQKKQANLSQIANYLAGSVVHKILGLTHSRISGLQRRLDTFIARFPDMKPQYTAFDKSKGNKIHLSPLRFLEVQFHLLSFFFLDVQPAIRAHKRQAEDDLISYLITQNYTTVEILAECSTFALAGIQAPREFICAATWHFLEQPELRARYLAASDEERDAMLQEIVRLESVVERLYRRATEDIPLFIESTNTHITIPAGALISINVYGANVDQGVVGEKPLELCPARELQASQVTSAVMSFGDGHHRCPGRYLALRETDLFLRRFLALEGLYIVKEPDLSWNDFLTSYMLRDFIVGIA